MRQETYKKISRILKGFADPAIAAHSQRFFKTGKGEYGEGDRFLGIRVPVLRKQARRFRHLALEEVTVLLRSRWHEERLCALFILVARFSQGALEDKAAIYKLYLAHTAYINNWDLVDSSAPHIVGAYLADKNRQPLFALAQSPSLWERRIAMLATLYLIRKNEFDDALEIAKILQNDAEDLIHKAVGWMLREVGKRDGAVERAFLAEHYQQMPRTMLRYAIEKFPANERRKYLEGTL